MIIRLVNVAYLYVDHMLTFSLIRRISDKLMVTYKNAIGMYRTT